MVRNQLILDVNEELIVDSFAGGGGASTGLELALGRHVDHAVNHDAAALGMHRINHPQTVHHCEDVFDIMPSVMVESRPVGFAWFSPDCKHFSKAKGGKPVSKKIRGLVLVMLRWAAYGTRVMCMENVEEIQTWGPLLPDGQPNKKLAGRTWKAFLDCLSGGIDPSHPDLPEFLEILGDSVSKAQLVNGFGYKYPCRTIPTVERFCVTESRTVVPPMTEEQINGARRVAKFLRKYRVEFEGEFATVRGFVIVDIGMRMLMPRELFLAQGFPASYVIDRAWIINPKTGSITERKLTKEEQIRMCGNSVSPPVAEAIISSNVPELARWSNMERFTRKKRTTKKRRRFDSNPVTA